MLQVKTPYLCGAAKRVELNDGSRLTVIGDSDLTDFIYHHAWFEGDEVALPREDRVYLLGSLTGRTPKKRRMTKCWSDLVNPNVATSCPLETEQHELDPDGTGADELVLHEMSIDDEGGCDNATSARKPMTANQKKVGGSQRP